MCPSGTGRFIADSWFSDEPLPAAYTHPAAARLRAIRRRLPARMSIGRQWKSICAKSTFPRPSPESAKKQASSRGLRKSYLTASRILSRHVGPRHGSSRQGRSGAVCARGGGIDRKPPEPSQPENKRERVAELLGRAGYASSNAGGHCWRQWMPGAAIAWSPWHRCALWARR